jgi:hypothetical protein
MCATFVNPDRLDCVIARDVDTLFTIGLNVSQCKMICCLFFCLV